MRNSFNILLISTIIFLSGVAIVGLVSYWWKFGTSSGFSPTVLSPVNQTSFTSLLQPSDTSGTLNSAAQPAKPVKLLFGGDLMFDRTIRQHMDTHGEEYILAPLKDVLTSYDAVVANLEGPVTTFASRSINSEVGSVNNFLFTFDPAVVPMLREYNISIVNLGNNHITNFGTTGVEQTKSFLTQNNVRYFGNTGLEKTSEERILYTEMEGHQLAFVNLNQFTDDGFAEGLADVQAADQNSNTDLLIVMTHWGNEYQATASAVIRQQAHQLIDAGADVIIGTHPHVIQNVEAYKGKVIYYSLGNFVFDQYFQQEVRKGWLVGMTIHPDLSLNFVEIPIELKTNGQTTLSP